MLTAWLIWDSVGAFLLILRHPKLVGMKQSLTLILLFLVTGCNSCLKGFYGTNNHTYLNITSDTIKLNNEYVEFYIDSVVNKNEVLPDSVKSLFYISSEQKDLFSDDRLIHFKDYPDEWYLISFDAIPCWIEAVYNKQLRDVAIVNKEYLSKEEIGRIKKRFEIEILGRAKLYAKQNNISDSVVYIK